MQIETEIIQTVFIEQFASVKSMLYKNTISYKFEIIVLIA